MQAPKSQAADWECTVQRAAAALQVQKQSLCTTRCNLAQHDGFEALQIAFGCSAGARSTAADAMRHCTTTGGWICSLDPVKHAGWGSRCWPCAAYPRVRAGNAPATTQAACVTTSAAAATGTSRTPPSMTTIMPRSAASTQLAGQLQRSMWFPRAAEEATKPVRVPALHLQGYLPPRCCLKTVPLVTASSWSYLLVPSSGPRVRA
jgi:hypothetical protein